jgi:hypothetical protein
MPQRSKRIEQDRTHGRHSHADAGGRQQNHDRKEVSNKVASFWERRHNERTHNRKLRKTLMRRASANFQK